MNYSSVKYIIYFSGFYSIGFAVFHAYFWRLFNWEEETKKLSVANNAILQIANIQLIIIFLGFAAICFIFPRALLSSKLGNVILIGISLFWLCRTIQQFIFLKIKNKFVNILTGLFILGTLSFASPVLIKLRRQYSKLPLMS